MPVYAVHTVKFGTLLKVDDCIAGARAWAKQFGPETTVSRHVETPICDLCGSRPCECRRRAR
jgi:hypothetical protein